VLPKSFKENQNKNLNQFRRDTSGMTSDTRSIISKSKSFSKYKLDRSFHDYEFVACKVINKEGLN